MEAADSDHLWLKPEHLNDHGHLFREPAKTTRIGDSYQAQIPTLLIEVMEYRANTHEYARNESNIFTSESDNDQFSDILSVLDDRSHELDALDKKNKLTRSYESGSILEHANFRLGFYLFGKKLYLVNKFTKLKKRESYYVTTMEISMLLMNTNNGQSIGKRRTKRRNQV